MADVGKVQGPSGPPENIGRKDKESADGDKFKQAMRRRVTEVSQVDPDEQKKRKRREEAEEEEDVDEVMQGQTTPASQVTPFSLEQEKKKTSPLEMQKGGAGISPTESAQPTQPSPHTTAFFQAPSTSEMQDDSGVLEEEAFIENMPPDNGAEPPRSGFGEQQPEASAQTAAPEQTPAFQPPQEGSPMPPQGQQPLSAGPPESSQQQEQQSQGQSKSAPQELQKDKTPGMAPKTSESLKKEQQRKAAAMQAGPSEQKEKAGHTAASLEGTPSSKVQDTSAFFEQMGKDGEKEEKKGKSSAKPTEEQEEEEAELQGASPANQPSPFAQSLERKEHKKVDEKDESATQSAMGPGLGTTELPGALPSPPPPETLPPYANLHPQVMELFDRMVGVMTVMSMSGMTETTITLNSPQFASSVFFGTQIIIQEFSTAPKAFNIQLNGNPQAVALFQGNADDLMAAFQAGNYNFRVNRLETGYLSERPLFKRKDKAAGKDKDQTGENPQ